MKSQLNVNRSAPRAFDSNGEIVQNMQMITGITLQRLLSICAFVFLVWTLASWSQTFHNCLPRLILTIANMAIANCSNVSKHCLLLFGRFWASMIYKIVPWRCDFDITALGLHHSGELCGWLKVDWTDLIKIKCVLNFLSSLKAQGTNWHLIKICSRSFLFVWHPVLHILAFC